MVFQVKNVVHLVIVFVGEFIEIVKKKLDQNGENN